MPMKKRPEKPKASRPQRISLAINLFSLVVLIVGFVLFVVGRHLNDAIADRIGAYLLLLGALVIGGRVFYWVLEEMIGRSMDSTGTKD